MATDKMVNAFRSDLLKFAARLEQSLSGFILCLVFQKKPSFGMHGWICCVCADGLDQMSDLAALSFVRKLLEETCSKETVEQVERVSVLHAYDPQLDDLLLDVGSVDDAAMLHGRSLFGRRIGRAQILHLRKPAVSAGELFALRA